MARGFFSKLLGGRLRQQADRNSTAMGALAAVDQVKKKSTGAAVLVPDSARRSAPSRALGIAKRMVNAHSNRYEQDDEIHPAGTRYPARDHRSSFGAEW
jgi:hypothetical protein